MLVDIIDKLKPMLDDAHWAEKLLSSDDNQFSRRAYIRSLFSMIEACTWTIKQAVRHELTTNSTKTISAAEYALLSDKTFNLKNSGVPEEQTKYLKLADNIKFTFNYTLKAFNIESSLGVGTQAWDSFIAAQKIRDRITHPRKSTDLQISDCEILTCKEVCSWFNSLILNFIKKLLSEYEKS
jgi:hypothetical protein